MDKKFSEILLKSSEVFMRYGLKSVTMDDIAREIKVSKKTLYKYVKDKSDLLCKVMQGNCSCDVVVIDEILERRLNAIDEIIEIGRYVAGQLKMMHPSIHYDMEKYYPEVWQLFENHKSDYLYGCVADNMARGMKEGLYRDNLNIEIMVKLYLSKIDLVFDATIFPPNKFNFVEVYMELLRYHIKGIASDNGVKYLRNEIKNENLNFYQ
ncbi:MAG: TetR/AcrR family transcriptional regulator [Flavobacteriales bacterium]|nr:TetR/AcrR family transcriptional regulator [Flavobacteriales bacterium]